MSEEKKLNEEKMIEGMGKIGRHIGVELSKLIQSVKNKSQNED